MPRGHKAGGSFVLFEHLMKRVNELGVRIISDAAVNALARDDKGDVIGVQYGQEGRTAVRRGI